MIISRIKNVFRKIFGIKKASGDTTVGDKLNEGHTVNKYLDKRILKSEYTDMYIDDERLPKAIMQENRIVLGSSSYTNVHGLIIQYILNEKSIDSFILICKYKSDFNDLYREIRLMEEDVNLYDDIFVINGVKSVIYLPLDEQVMANFILKKKTAVIVYKDFANPLPINFILKNTSIVGKTIIHSYDVPDSIFYYNTPIIKKIKILDENIPDGGEDIEELFKVNNI